MNKVKVSRSNDYLLNLVAFIRSLGYLGQISGGLYFAGTLSFIGALPLIIYGDNKYSKSKFSLIKNNALAIHSYAGVITAIPIIVYGITGFNKTTNYAYLEISLVGICISIAYVLFKTKLPSYRSRFTNTIKFIYKYKHQLGSCVLLIGNIFQYHTGIVLGRGGLSVASVFFIVAIATQFFVKSRIVKNEIKENTTLGVKIALRNN